MSKEKEKKELKKQGTNTGLEVAVIGMAGRFPGARSIDEFRENLKNGVESIAFFSDRELEKEGIDVQIIKNPNYVKAKGIIEDIAYFDAAFFEYTPLEAEIMDPQMRVFHECCWEALEDAGYDPDHYDGLIGLFAGASSNIYWQGLTWYSGKSAELGNFAAANLGNRDFLSTTISYKLNLKGPAMVVQTACSTSLAAIHWASRSLLLGECDMALAGGIAIHLPQKKGYMYREGMVGSSDGRCRAFDARAKGTAGGEGGGIVVMKRLKKALAHGDHMYALVKGSAINNDGKRKVGFTAPSTSGQAEVIRTALAVARVEPESIGYIETHGTGTILGDPIEIEALTMAFKPPPGASPGKQHCAVGSVKTNIGHLDTGAGVAGFIKTVLALKNRLIPPSLHFETPNPGIDFENSPFYVNTTLREWKSETYPLRAGVSSFGIGGTNVHVILEEAPEGTRGLAPLIGKARGYQLIVLSARTPTALDRASENLKEYFERNPGVNLNDAAYTLQIGRRPFEYRKIAVCSTLDEAIAALSARDTGKIQSSHVIIKDHRPVVFMFPGLGAQYENMGLELYRTEPVFRQEMDRCFEFLKSLVDFDIKEIIYPPAEGNMSYRFYTSYIPPINQTEIAQLVVFIVEYALAKLLITWGITPRAMIGYSFGEYAAACISGVFSLEDALKLVVTRGQLVNRLPRGGMLSVPIAGAQLEPLLPPPLSISIDNGPSCVVSGPQEEVSQFEKQMKENKYLCMRLEASCAFHSSMMNPILEEFKREVGKISLNQPQIPYISNVTGKWITSGEAADPAYWVRHLRETVRFAGGIKELAKQQGNDNAVWVEVGPGRDLSALVMRFIENNPRQTVISLQAPPGKTVSEAAFLLDRIGQLWLWGVDIHWHQFYQGEKPHRISLPTYPFEKQRYWIDGDTSAIGAKMLTGNDRLLKKPDMADWFYIPSWKRFRLSANDIIKIPTQTCWLMFMDDCGVGIQLAKELEKMKHKVVTVKKGLEFTRESANGFTINPRKGRDNDYSVLFDELRRKDLIPDKIVHLWGISMQENKELEIESIRDDLDSGFYSLLAIAQAIGENKWDNQIHITVVTNNMQEVTGDDNLCPGKVGVLGAVGVIPAEYPNLSCRSIDVVLPKPGSPQEKELIAQLSDEFFAAPGEPIVAYRNNHCWVRSFEPVRLEKSNKENIRLRQNDVYLITGGLGGIGLALAEYLAARVRARLVLTGRSRFPPKNKWEEWLANNEEDNVVSRNIRKIREIEQLGAEVLVFSADVANREHMQAVITQTLKWYGRINGVIHSAGIPGGEMIQRRTRETSERIFAAKITGTLVLHCLLEDLKPDFFMICSSLSSILPAIGQVGYCAANAFVDAFANYKTSKQNMFTLSINWDRWKNVGMAVINEKQHKELTGEDSQGGITSEEAVEAFHRILADKHPQVVLSSHDLKSLVDYSYNFKISSFVEKLKKTTIPRIIFQRPEIDTEYRAPETRVEQVIADIWARFFGFEKVGIHDDFFEIGGDSLKAITIISRIHEQLNVELSLAEFFKYPTIRQLAQYISRDSQRSPFTSIPLAETREYYPLSSAQERLYVVHRMQTDSTSYNMPYVLEVETGFERHQLEKVFKELIRRHESLRTSFEIINNEPIQRVHDDVDFEIEYYQVKVEEEEQTTDDRRQKTEGKAGIHLSSVIRHLSSEFIRPFDLSKAPLLRVGWIHLHTPPVGCLIVDLHHIIADGISLQVLAKEFMILAAGENLPLLKMQYKDFAWWRKAEKNRVSIKKQQEYWLQELQGEIPVLNLPYDYPRPVIQSFAGSRTGFHLTGFETAGLNEIARAGKFTLFMVLLTALSVFLAKLSNQEDIIMGTPVSGRRHSDLDAVMGIFVNVMGLRTYPSGKKAFRTLLKEVRKKTSGAFENQDYPFEDLIKTLSVPRDTGRNPLFDVVFSLEDPFSDHNKKFLRGSRGQFFQKAPPGRRRPKIVPYAPGEFLHTSKFDLTLTADHSGENLSFTFTYCTGLFKEETILRFIQYFKQVLLQVTDDPDGEIQAIEIIPLEEKQRVLFEFNDTDAEYPADKAIHQLLAEQVERAPDRIALVGREEGGVGTRFIASDSRKWNIQLTYNQLNEKFNQLASRLGKRGVQPGTIVGIMVGHSIEMIIGIISILKAGGAYLPIDPGYPEKRIQYMLTDSSAKFLVTSPGLPGKFKKLSIVNCQREQPPSSHLHLSPAPVTSLAYIIYTSGSTGRPKGVMIENRSLVNLCIWHNRYYAVTEKDNATKYADIGFDASVWEIFPYLVKGACLHIISDELKLDLPRLNEYFETHHITISFLPTPICEAFIQQENHSLRVLLTGGDRLRNYQKKNYQLVNNYGPTENTVVTTSFPVERNHDNIPIGRPIDNTQLYILNKYNHLQPIGVVGELWISGHSLARGYLNQPELTVNKFCLRRPGGTLFEKTVPPGPPCKNFLYDVAPGKEVYHRSYMSYLSYIYRTGDLARWLPDGNIQFLGRIDNQVKVRGFRIELGEIESRLLKHNQIKDAIVIARESAGNTGHTENREKYLCAYIVPGISGANGGKMLDAGDIKQYLSLYLPGYMIPAQVEIIDRIPLTSSGKLDRTALPAPGKMAGDHPTVPGNQVEKKLLEIWSHILGIEEQGIGIDSNFFELGGHSLNAMTLVTRIHKDFHVKLPLVNIFTDPTIKAIAKQIQETAKEVFQSIHPAEKKEYYPLSSTQRRTYILQQMELSSVAYNVYGVYEIEGQADKGKLEEIFRHLITRHESLRTSFDMINEEPVQKVHDKVKFEIEYCQVETEVEEIEGTRGLAPLPEESHLSSVICHPSSEFIRPFDLSRAPLLRVRLIKMENQKYLLMKDMHHIVTDGVSQEILVREFASLYNSHSLPNIRLQYKDYAQWQQTRAAKGFLKQQEKYWLMKFQDEIPWLNLPFDYTRPTVQDFAGSTEVFDTGVEESPALHEILRSQEVTLFILLLAVFKIFLYKISSQEDLAVGIPIAGRNHVHLESIIGMFVNTLVLRTQPLGDKTAGEFLKEVKKAAFEAFENQDYPFEDLVEKAALERDWSRNPLFDVMFALHDLPAASGPGKKPAVPMGTAKLKPYTIENKTSKFDLTLTAINRPEQLLFSFEYSTKLFKKGTILRFIQYFKHILSRVIDDIGQEIKQIEIITREEKQQVLFEFNNTAVEYPKDKTLDQLFSYQVNRIPDNTALVAQGVGTRFIASDTDKQYIHLTYNLLNEKANELAQVLRDKGVGPDVIVGIMAGQSFEMIIGILGILKAGGAYLPIDPDYPRERIDFMLADSNAKVLVNSISSVSSVTSVAKKSSHLHLSPAPVTSVAYILYTSGTTGKPKGVMIEHRSVVNQVSWLARLYHLRQGVHVIQMYTYTFDGHVNQVFGALLHGAALYPVTRELLGNMDALRDYIIKNHIHFMDFVPMFLDDLLTHGKKMSSLQVIISAGDKLEEPVKDKIIARDYPLYNHYGPTETTVDALSSKCTTGNANPGKPVANAACYVLDNYRELLPVGVTGELYISGAGVARGYLNNPALTARKFMPDPFRTGQRMYRSGDLGRWLADGNIQFLGRKDTQVKIRGIRVELGEIEAHLVSHHSIKEAVVLAREKGPGEKYLCAYIVKTRENPGTVELREYLFQRLPPAVIPSTFIYLDKLPITPNGKVDRKALEKIANRQDPGTPYVSPRNEIERKIIDTWQEVLHLDKVGIHDNYFELGGTSLDILRVHAKLKEEFQADIPMAVVFMYPTVHSFAQYLNEGEKELRDRSREFKRGKRDRMQRLEKRRGVKTNGRTN